jgi:ABC-type transporter Mla subunit MlaD
VGAVMAALAANAWGETLADVTKERDALKQQCDDLQAKVAALTTKIAALENGYAKLQKTCDDLSNALAQTKQLVDLLRSQPPTTPVVLSTTPQDLATALRTMGYGNVRVQGATVRAQGGANPPLVLTVSKSYIAIARPVTPPIAQEGAQLAAQCGAWNALSLRLRWFPNPKGGLMAMQVLEIAGGLLYNSFVTGIAKGNEELNKTLQGHVNEVLGPE